MERALSGYELLLDHVFGHERPCDFGFEAALCQKTATMVVDGQHLCPMHGKLARKRLERRTCRNGIVTIQGVDTDPLVGRYFAGHYGRVLDETPGAVRVTTLILLPYVEDGKERMYPFAQPVSFDAWLPRAAVVPQAWDAIEFKEQLKAMPS